MLESILNIFFAIFVDLPEVFLYLLVYGGAAYMVSLIVIGFPVSIWESITKKKVNDDIESKIIRIVAICLFALLLLTTFIQEGV